jgi:hypothetical protein
MRTALLGKAVLVPDYTLTLRLPRALNETIGDAIVCGDYRCQEDDLLPNVPPFISRVRSGYAPLRGGLQTRLG